MTDITAPLRLDDLIEVVKRSRATPLDRVTSATALGAELDEMADALIGYFVDQARRSGATWSDIGRSMGMTKQAAQKRFVAKPSDEPLDASQGFSRFDVDARSVVVKAQELARAAGHDQITVAHLTLALIDDPSGLAARAITAQGVGVDDVTRVARATMPEPASTVPALIPFDAHAQTALKLTFSVAQRRGADVVDTGHVLLALLEADDGTGVLAGLGVTPDGLEASLDQLGLAHA